MKKLNSPAEVKKGDKFYIQYGTSSKIAKCIWNDVENKTMEVQIYLKWLDLFSVPYEKEICKYSDYRFDNFKAKNQ